MIEMMENFSCPHIENGNSLYRDCDCFESLRLIEASRYGRIAICWGRLLDCGQSVATAWLISVSAHHPHLALATIIKVRIVPFAWVSELLQEACAIWVLISTDSSSWRTRTLCDWTSPRCVISIARVWCYPCYQRTCDGVCFNLWTSGQ